MCFSTLIKVKHLLQFNYECDNRELIIAAVKPRNSELTDKLQRPVRTAHHLICFPNRAALRTVEYILQHILYTLINNSSLGSHIENIFYALRKHRNPIQANTNPEQDAMMHVQW